MIKIKAGITGIYTGSFGPHPCTVLDIKNPRHPEWWLLEFHNEDGVTVGWLPDGEDKTWGIVSRPGVSYLWLTTSDEHFRADEPANPGYYCCECNNHNKWAEANLTDNRHICYSCKSVYAWKYEGQWS